MMLPDGPTRVSFASNTTLLMYSGGLDSLGALYLLLKQGHTVHVHHVVLVTVENRWSAEQAAVELTCGWLKRHGFSFTRSTSLFQVDAYRDGFLYDADSFNLIGGGMAHLSRGAIARVAIGATLSDDTPESHKASRRGREIYQVMTTVPKIYPVGLMTKQQIWDMLPQELRALSWSCRTPIVSSASVEPGLYVPCRRCKSCRALAALRL